MSKEKFYITTAIAYTSKKPHIGNTYEIVLTDAIARFNRFIGKDVFFLTGTDEHGQKIQEIAENEGITPKQHVDKIAGQIKDIADMLNISYDKFIRTTDDYHVKAVQQIFGDTWMNIIGTRYGEKLFMGKQWGAPHKENRATGCRRYD